MWTGPGVKDVGQEVPRERKDTPDPEPITAHSFHGQLQVYPQVFRRAFLLGARNYDCILWHLD